MSQTTIDERLINTCYKLATTNISNILLSKNSLVTWFIIVPTTNKIEWHDLDIDLQTKLNAQICNLSKLLTNHFKVDKINIAIIGNIVPQMHIHIIGRKKTDPFWPGVVWGRPEFKEYTPDNFCNIKKIVTNTLLDCSTL